MPVKILLIGGCWILGSLICGLFYYASFILTSASVGNMVLISVDRYVAICDPLCYPTRVTQRRVKLCVCLSWACALFYNGSVIVIDFLNQPDRYNSCYGECILVIDFITGAVDIILTFVGPIAVIIVLYMRVFVVAVSQARAMRSHVATVTLQGSVGVNTKKSERKAARTLGVIVVVFLICFCPYFYPSLAGQDTSSSVAFSVFGVWLLYCNSCLNPIVYAFFYPWFRRSMKLIVTLQILQPDSCDANILWTGQTKKRFTSPPHGFKNIKDCYITRIGRYRGPTLERGPGLGLAGERLVARSLPTGDPPGSARNGNMGPPSSRLTTRRKVHKGPVPCGLGSSRGGGP
ncbi:hypothetical protein L3Q82_017281 [Scortum barcoo]|uniref:Uncharacterized protein n=1 Tax=Scortum barcoo TaxID=214431 RepID=A0ACB8VK07_9TELE|nr:hypothetical protein L3Q82_017281 [Scortum barcoo]